MHQKNSTTGILSASSLLSHITTVKLHTANWKGTNSAFILNWCDKLHQYGNLVDATSQLSDPVKCTLLQNAVAGIKELNQVKMQGELEIAQWRNKDVLLQVATTIDQTLILQRPTWLLQNVHELEYYEHDINEDEMFDHNIDTDFRCLEINAAQQGRRFGPSMDRSTWQTLITED